MIGVNWKQNRFGLEANSFIKALTSSHNDKQQLQHTVYEYRLVCQRYVEMVGDHPVKNVKNFHESLFLSGLKQKGVREHTQAKYLRQLQTFWRWAFDQEYTIKMFRV